MTVPNSASQFMLGRARLANHLERIHLELAGMLKVWAESDLPGDVLAQDEYPFHLSVDEIAAEVHDAIEMIRDRNLLRQDS